MMEVTSPSPSANGANGLAAFPTIDLNLVVEYLASVLEITLGASRRDLECIGSLLSKSRHADTVQRCTRFASEAQVALYVQKDITAGDGLDGVIEESSMPFLQCDHFPS
jgi:dynein heavy chain 1